MLCWQQQASPFHLGEQRHKTPSSNRRSYKVLLENDQVRVLEYHLKPGEKEPMHTHPAGVVYIFGDAKMKTSYPDGRTEEIAGGAGEAHWRNPVTHALENIGTTEAHALAIDVKKPCKAE